MTDQMIAPGSTIGIMGGGQLGRMSACAAAALGYRVHIFTPEIDSPASHVADMTMVADYDNEEALRQFGEQVDVITFEFENVPAASVKLLESLACSVRPRWKILEISQNRIREKTFINAIDGVATAPFAAVTSAAELKSAFVHVGTQKAILKTTELGYDGKGQFVLNADDDLDAAWEHAKMQEGVLEAFIPFEAEISAIIARNPRGETAIFPPAKNVHKNGILDISIVPSGLGDVVEQAAIEQATKIAEALELRGLLAVEFFVTRNGTLLVNEVAPRPHNSGHWTMDGCETSQFEQFIRAVCNLPLGSTALKHPTEMKNLIGDDVHDWPNIVQNPKAKLHLYGKAEARAGRKMGHVNFIK